MIISLVNQKGGVGKTTTAVNLAAALASNFNKKVLLIDMDPQGDASNYAGIEIVENETTLDFLLNKKLPILKSEYFDVISTDIVLADFEMMASAALGREFILRKKIKEYDLKEKYEYIIIDCPPSFGLLATNSLVASDTTIIPVTLEHFSIKGLVSLFDTISGVESLTDTEIDKKVLVNGSNRSYKHHNETLEELNEYISDFKLETEIKQDVAVSRSQKSCQNVFLFDEKTKVEENYISLAKEVIESAK